MIHAGGAHAPLRPESPIMKYVKILFLLSIAFGVFFYNSNWFQASFFPETYYQDICLAPFDVTRKNETITIPLKYGYDTCYRLAVAVPDKNIFHDNIIGPGDLMYRFVSKGQTLAKGHTRQPSKQHLMLNNGTTSINILVFNLPFPGAGEDLELQLTVHEPFHFLNAYKGRTFCKINADYNPKFGKCYNEELMISD